MARRLRLEDLIGSCETSALLNPSLAERAVDRLGWLAPWWLRPEVIEQARKRQPAYAAYATRPRLPCEPGGCWVILVNPRKLSLLQEAFLLPLRWEKQTDDDPHLPGPLRELAVLVCQQLDDGASGRWGLWLAVPSREERIDLSPLDAAAFGAKSAWASLAGGLLLARDGLSPDGSVWASAAWDETYGVGQVDGIHAKLNLAAEWEARQFFLPAQNQPEVSTWHLSKGSRPPIDLLSPTNSDPARKRVLEPYLERLGVEPRAGASFEVCKRYYLRVDRKRADEFYWARLMEGDILRCRKGVPKECHPTHMVTVVSPAPAVVAMAPATLGAQRCLLLYEGELKGTVEKALRQVQEFLQARGITCQAGPLAGETVSEQKESARQAVEGFATGVPAEELAFDLTPGYKNLSLALEAAAPRGAWLLYCRHEQDGPDRRPKPGSQSYDCWRKDG